MSFCFERKRKAVREDSSIFKNNSQVCFNFFVVFLLIIFFSWIFLWNFRPKLALKTVNGIINVIFVSKIKLTDLQKLHVDYIENIGYSVKFQLRRIDFVEILQLVSVHRRQVETTVGRIVVGRILQTKTWKRKLTKNSQKRISNSVDSYLEHIHIVRSRQSASIQKLGWLDKARLEPDHRRN